MLINGVLNNQFLVARAKGSWHQRHPCLQLQIVRQHFTAGIFDTAFKSCIDIGEIFAHANLGNFAPPSED
ncbi:Uncharacterised protein [Salmonella enterica subsp. enterica serovar Bovismorbificans]|nr:Uncharacterised protein [Salmonella enterica subsp. enterica serovar Bovismorbificans]